MRTLHAGHLLFLKLAPRFILLSASASFGFISIKCLTESGCGNAHWNWRIHIHEENQVSN